MKASFLTLCIALFAVAARAQDKIYKKAGPIIIAKVISVSDKKITYKLFDDPDSTEHTILIANVAEIVYHNNTVDFFNTFEKLPDDKKAHQKQKDKSHSSNEGKNIFAVIPLAYTAATDGSINDPGIGLSYERLLGRNGRFGFIFPVMLSFSSSKDFADNVVSVNGTNLTYGHYTSVYFMPGMKFYPAHATTKVRYSIGASFFCIFGGEPEAVYEANSPSVTYPVYGTQHYALCGLMLTNSVNITVEKHLYLAIDLSAGLPFIDNRYAAPVDGLGVPVPFIQIGFKIGYRY